jgi:hypothetical protein
VLAEANPSPKPSDRDYVTLVGVGDRKVYRPANMPEAKLKKLRWLVCACAEKRRPSTTAPLSADRPKAALRRVAS